jgi:4'-phosphopantetheinyl transferase
MQANSTVYLVREFHLSVAQLEQPRAARWYFQKDRGRCIVTRGLLLGFCHNSQGKPRLSDEFRMHSICFNVSHSKELALFAVTRGRKVGVDLEWIRSGPADEQIDDYFSPREAHSLGAFDKAVQDEAFFNCSTTQGSKQKGERSKRYRSQLDSFDVSFVAV